MSSRYTCIPAQTQIILLHSTQKVTFNSTTGEILHMYFISQSLICSTNIANHVSVRNITLVATPYSPEFSFQIFNNTNMAVARAREVKNTSTIASGAAWDSDCLVMTISYLSVKTSDFVMQFIYRIWNNMKAARNSYVYSVRWRKSDKTLQLDA